jgi:hypothetical protein
MVRLMKKKGGSRLRNKCAAKTPIRFADKYRDAEYISLHFKKMKTGIFALFRANSRFFCDPQFKKGEKTVIIYGWAV